MAASGATLVGSTLESLGYYYQSYFLDTLNPYFGSSIGGLIYVLGGIIALASVALTGRYKFGLWLLLGPGLFFAVVMNRTEIEPAEWRFAGRPQVVNAVKQEVAQTLASQPVFLEHFGGFQGNTLPLPRVSSVFAFFTELVSNSVQQVSFIIVNERDRLNHKILVRAELITATQAAKVSHSGLKELIHHGLVSECREVMGYAQKAKGHGTSPALQVQYRDKMNQVLDEQRVTVSAKALEYIAQLRVDYAAYWNQIRNSAPATADSTNTLIVGLLQALELRDASLQTDTTSAASRRNARDAYIEYEAPMSCREIWGVVYVGVHLEALKVLEQTQEQAKKLNIFPEEIICDMKKLLAPNTVDAEIDVLCEHQNDNTDPSIQFRPWHLYRIIARYILRNELSVGRPASAFLRKIEKQSLGSASKGAVSESASMNPIFAERLQQELQEWEQRSRIQRIADSMPYYQGLTLFVLGAVFPFFALLLLIPGKHPAFIRFFQLWLWVKCWDVGFAIVMLLDQILFNLMSVAQVPNADSAPSELDPDLSIALLSMRELDPSFNLGTYYHIISIALVSVPPIMSQLILGVMGGGAGFIRSGVMNFGEFYSEGQRNGWSNASLLGNRLQALGHSAQQAKGFVDERYRGSNPTPLAMTKNYGLSNPRPNGYGIHQGNYDISGNQHQVFVATPRYSQQYRNGANLSELHSQTVKNSKRRGIIGGLKEGTSAVDHQNPWSAGFNKTKQWVGGVANSVLGVGGQYVDLQEKRATRVGDKVLDQQSTQGDFYGMNSEYSQNRLAVARGGYGMIEIPWLQQAGAWKEEAALLWQESVENPFLKLKAILGIASDVTGAVNDAKAKRKDPNEEKPALEVLGKGVKKVAKRVVIGGTLAAPFVLEQAGKDIREPFKVDPNLSTSSDRSSPLARVRMELSRVSLDNHEASEIRQRIASGNDISDLELLMMLKQLKDDERSPDSNH